MKTYNNCWNLSRSLTVEEYDFYHKSNNLCVQWRIQDFPYGGRGPRKGGMDTRGGYISKILYVKTKESGPLGRRDVRRVRPLDPPLLFFNVWWQHCKELQNINTFKLLITEYLLVLLVYPLLTPSKKCFLSRVLNVFLHCQCMCSSAPSFNQGIVPQSTRSTGCQANFKLRKHIICKISENLIQSKPDVDLVFIARVSGRI